MCPTHMHKPGPSILEQAVEYNLEFICRDLLDQLSFNVSLGMYFKMEDLFPSVTNSLIMCELCIPRELDMFII